MTTSGYAYAIAAAITWGLVYVIDQKVLKGASAFALLFVDSFITAAILLPVVFFEKDSLVSLSTLSAKTWILAVASLILAALANWFIFSSIKLIGADHASIFEIIYPFFVVVFSYFAFSVVPNVYFLLGSILIFAGSAIIVLFG